jgi:hypothetical protein
MYIYILMDLPLFQILFILIQILHWSTPSFFFVSFLISKITMNSSFAVEFTDQEIKEQLKSLGFKNISQDKFQQFKRGKKYSKNFFLKSA